MNPEQIDIRKCCQCPLWINFHSMWVDTDTMDLYCEEHAPEGTRPVAELV